MGYEQWDKDRHRAISAKGGRARVKKGFTPETAITAARISGLQKTPARLAALAKARAAKAAKRKQAR